MQTLAIIVHPDLTQSRHVKAVMQTLAPLSNVTLHNLYARYPDFQIDVAAEQALLLAHEQIVVVFPLYWYSTPALFKQWLDVVLTKGWAYGGASALADKSWRILTTTGGPKEAYTTDGYNRYSLEELFRPFEMTARLCKMNFLPPLAIQGVYRLSDEELQQYCQNLIPLLGLETAAPATH